MTFTPAQQTAIDTLNPQVVVSAAAGSGKTAVLVARILKRITDPLDATDPLKKEIYPVDIDQLLVVTFTKAAAGEMKERLTHALGARMSVAVPDTPLFHHLRRQLFLLNRANITTIDAFCRKVVVDSFHLLGLDPGFKTMNPEEAPLFMDKAMTRVFDARYEAQDTLFKELVNRYGGKFGDNGLSDPREGLIVQLYAAARESLSPREWLASLSVPYTQANAFEVYFLPLIREQLHSVLTQWQKALTHMARLAHQGVAIYEPKLAEVQVAVDSGLMYLANHRTNVLAVQSIVATLADAKLTKLPTVTTKLKATTDMERKEQIADLFKALRDQAKGLLASGLFVPPAEANAELHQMAPTIHGLSQLTLSFDQAYEALKREQNVLDFSDLNHYAIAALKQAEVQANFSYVEVFIDEYQDSNPIQEFILSRVAQITFIVGDVKQSIYRFRGAMPQLFNSKLNPGQFIPLSQNFRSRQSVIDGTNHVFAHLLPPTDISYDTEAQLYLGATYPAIPADTIDIHLIEAKDADQDKISLETQLIAQQIKQLMASQTVSDKGETRPLRYSDIVILSRKKSRFTTLVEGLHGAGIPVVSERQSNFFETPEIRLLISWLHLIDNPIQDIALLSVLSCYRYEVTPDHLVSLRKSNKGLFFSVIEAYLANDKRPDTDGLRTKLSQFMTDLTQLRQFAARNETVSLLLHLIETTNYLNHVASLSGQIGLDNVNIMIEQAGNYHKKDLYSFIRYMEQLLKRNISIGQATTADSLNAVTVMTIHKSKGLEYPVVFVCDMDGSFSAKDTEGDVIIHKTLGIGAKYIDTTGELRIKRPSVASQVISAHIRNENIAEEVRLLYVAFTRAKEKLILVAAVKDIAKREQAWLTSRESHHVYSCKSYLAMVMPWVMDNDLFSISRHQPADWEASETTPSMQAMPQAQPVATEEHLAPYPLVSPYTSPYVHIPANLNISQIKGNAYKQRAYERGETLLEATRPLTLNVPGFLQETQGLTPGQVGNAHHMVMERLSFANTAPDQIGQVVSDLVAKQYLSEAEAQVIQASWIAKLLQSDLGQRMAVAERAGKLHRETPFAMKITPAEAQLLGYTHLNQPEDEQITIHGIIDAYFEENGQIILVDYKTDKASPHVVAQRYRLQLEFYQTALAAITHKTVAQRLIYLFHTGDIIPI